VQLSVEVAYPVEAGTELVPQAIVLLVGHVIDGGSIS